MAVAITRPAGADYTAGNKKVKVRDIAFSGNYATGGETINASDVGLRKIEQVNAPPIAPATALTTACPVAFVINSTGTAVTVVSYEGSAAGTPLSEKTNAEAYITGQSIRASFIGY